MHGQDSAIGFDERRLAGWIVRVFALKMARGHVALTARCVMPQLTRQIGAGETRRHASRDGTSRFDGRPISLRRRRRLMASEHAHRPTIPLIL